MLDIIVFGTISGSIILFAALGFSMILKTEGFINVGHGQMLMLGAYFGLLGNNQYNGNNQKKNASFFTSSNIMIIYSFQLKMKLYL